MSESKPDYGCFLWFIGYMLFAIAVMLGLIAVLLEKAVTHYLNL